MKTANWKKVWAALLAALLLAGCAQAAPKEDVPAMLLEEGVRLTALMGRLAGSEPYRALYTGSDELAAVVGEMAGEYGVPESAYRITLPQSAGEAVLYAAGLAPGELTPELQKLAYDRTAAALPNLVNGTVGGSSVLAASSILAVNSNLQTGGLGENTLLLLRYGRRYDSMVAFIPDEKGVVDASAWFVLLPEEFSPEELPDWLAQAGGPVGLEGVECAAYAPEELAALSEALRKGEG